MTSADGTDKPVRLLRNRDFQVIWIGETLSTIGGSMTFLVFPLIGLAITGSPVLAALTGTAARASSLAVMLPAGAWVDRANRKVVMVSSSAVLAALYATLTIALLADRLTLTHLLVVAVLGSAISTLHGPAEQASIRTIVPPEQLPAAFSQNEARGHVGGLIGPPLGGALFALARWVPFAVDAATYLASALLVSTVRTPLPAPERHAEVDTVRRQIVEGLRFVLGHAFFRAVALFAAFSNFAWVAILTAIVLKLGEAGVNPAAIGSINAAEAAAGLVGAALAPMLIKRVPSGFLTIGLGVVFGLVVIPIALTDHVVVIAGALVFAGLVNPAGNVAIFSYLTAVTPDRLQGRVSSALPFLALALEPLAPITAGVLLHTVGGRTTLLILAAVVALAVVPLLVTREVRELSTPDKWNLEELTSPSR